MLAAHDAMERSLTDFISLFQQNSEKFHFVGETSGDQDGASRHIGDFFVLK